MNKGELVAYMATEANISKKAAALALKSAIVAINTVTDRGGVVSVAGLGMFKRVQTDARVGRDFVRGVPVQIPPTLKLSFRPAKTAVITAMHL